MVFGKSLRRSYQSHPLLLQVFHIRCPVHQGSCPCTPIARKDLTHHYTPSTSGSIAIAGVANSSSSSAFMGGTDPPDDHQHQQGGVSCPLSWFCVQQFCKRWNARGRHQTDVICSAGLATAERTSRRPAGISGGARLFQTSSPSFSLCSIAIQAP